MLNVFEEIKERLPMLDVVKFYGLQVGRSGMACCPFHNDKTPSMKIYPDHFYCFGCGESGDGTGFVAKLFGISQLEAAKKISYDFGLNLFNGEIAVPVKKAPNSNAEYFRWLKNAQSAVSEYLNKLYQRRKNPLFVESMQKMSYIEYLNEILRYGTDSEKREMFRDNPKEIQNIAERLKKLDSDRRTVKHKTL